ncbi:BTAD domain-containing putative transcriptional regulator [Kribbella jiaozuonensis]|uniref:BTAD domain-containing putative transcriptional regulator n=1 Tax=Kribbella jiaozuonensis TaxID=2575441 RepID=UPI00192E1E45|nr:BTAD domain-containing putative transcriptional regulator [Kribbella jiaozuonensis]
MAGPIRSVDDGRESVDAGLRLQILGPLRLWRNGAELATGPRQQAYLLALLLATVGQPTSTHELIDLIWGDDPPRSALNVLHKYVGSLRRLLEPDLAARGSGSYLQRHGSGYLFATGPGMLDLADFREYCALAGAESHPETALDWYSRGVRLWRGPAAEGMDHGPGAESIFAGLAAEYFDACVAATEIAISLGHPTQVLPSLRRAATMAPLHEPVQASLVRALGAAGRQAEALEVYRTVQGRLAEDLGIDPGEALQAAQQRVLRRTTTQSVGQLVDGESLGGGLVGRAEELVQVRQLVGSALGGGSGVLLVEGEPGVGKTRLLEQAAAEAGARGALVVWGNCLPGDGTPSMWPWVQVVRAIADRLSAGERETVLNDELARLLEPSDAALDGQLPPGSSAQFRLAESVVAMTGKVSARQPVLIVIDDLQWADVASLDLFTHLVDRLPGGAVVIGALRDRGPAPHPEVARTLASASRLPGHRRTRLGPLDVAEVGELVRRETGAVPDAGVTRRIFERTAGNPFFVRELSRYLTGRGGLTEDAAMVPEPPSTVRDVVRDRIADLDDDVLRLLQLAALIGREVELDLLARAAGLTVEICLARLEPLQALGLIDVVAGDPFSCSFAHDLVREAVVGIMPTRQATELHLRIGTALESVGGEEVAERLAYHLWAAGPLVEPARIANALVAAGRCAANKSAFEAAERHLERAVRIARSTDLPELELSALSQLTSVVGMRVGYVGSAPDLLERAEAVARRLGREPTAADFLFTRWIASTQGMQINRGGRLARRLLDHGEASSDPVVRAYGLSAWGVHQWDIGNVGEAYRCLNRIDRDTLDKLARRETDPLRRDLHLNWPPMHAMLTAVHLDDLDGSRKLLDTLEAATDDPFALSIWAYFASMAGVMAGDPVWALHAADRAAAADPEHVYAYFGSRVRIERCWAMALLGNDPAGAAEEAEAIIAKTLVNPPRTGLAYFYALHAEMLLAAGTPSKAGAVLDQADRSLDTHGQRYAESLLHLVRAHQLQATNAPLATIRAAATAAHTTSTTSEARLFTRRTAQFLATLE